MRGKPDAAHRRDPITVLFVIGTLDVGGAETQLVELVTRIDRTRFRPVVCSLAGEGPLAARLRAAAVALHTLEFTGFREDGAWTSAPRAVAQLWRLFRVIRAERPDILHGVLFWAYVLGAFAGRAARVPVVVASRRSLGLFKADKPHYLFLERMADRLTDLFVANSEAVRIDTIARERLDGRSILVVHNGIDLSRFEPRERDASPVTAPRVLVVSNLIEYKGHRYFLEAWRGVVAQFPRARALFAGEGVMLDALRAQAAALGIEDRVEFLGRRSDIAELLRTSDLYVHPSLQEGYSNALLEAMASGIPIVATAVGGNTEAIADGATGLLVPPADAAGLEHAMLRLLTDRSTAVRMGREAAAAVRRRHEIGRVVAAYERIYTRLAAGDRPAYESPADGMNECAV